jgi:hypothetical protein
MFYRSYFVKKNSALRLIEVIFKVTLEDSSGFVILKDTAALLLEQTYIFAKITFFAF